MSTQLAEGDTRIEQGSDNPTPAPEPELEPITNAPYVLTVDGIITDGQSDGEGKVEVSITPNARQATIKFYPGTDKESIFPLNLGEMDSIETLIGVRKRLFNLGYRCAPEGDEFDPALKDALMRFKAQNHLDATGEIDQKAKDKLVEVHGS